ncbi:putative metal-binding, possibly nucleic acid-binding protein [Bifidobacterium pullorum]|uniref:Putative metal-binding, possibly nucleic acid-binding protein n=1 Tax=Bifidobacterium pullorum TaxID=78448 RepID=A0A7V8HPQ9_9BIFI|nr:putative metal-binding, possibly nucleic acid-binding protein [Bifidobacterium pullorum]
MPRPEDSQWAVSVAQVASRPGQSKPIDTVFPAPSGIGDDIVGVREGADVRVVGSFDSIVDGLVFTGRIEAPLTAECTRCLKPIDPDWTVNATLFFPYDAPGADDGRGNGEVEIIAGEDEAEDVYPLSSDGAFADMESPLRDTLVEALPLQPLCKEDCLGLCPQCGVDLNEDPDHHHDVTDIRFAALEQFKARLEAEEHRG